MTMENVGPKARPVENHWARPLQHLEMLLTEPLLSCPGCMFRVVMLEDPATTHLQCSYWGKAWPRSRDTWPHPSSFQYGAVVCPLCRKASPKNDVSTSKLHSWDGVLGVVLILLLPPNKASGVLTNKLYFCLIRPHDLLPFLLWIIQMVIGKLQMGLDMRWLEQGDRACAAGF